MPTDVLVIGAGPAGTVAALTLARQGVRVRLVDRARFPRDKLCGDTVNPGTLALLDTLGLGARVRAAALPIRGMTVTGPHDARVSAAYPDGIAGAALTRRQLDQILVDAAVEAGARLDDGLIVTRAVTDSGGRVNGVSVRHDGRETAIPAGVVIAADGRASRLGSSLGLSSFARRPRRWAFGAYYEGVAGVSDRGEMHVRSDGYVGVAPVPGGLVNVCCVRDRDHLRRADVNGSAALPAQVLTTAINADRHLRDRFAAAVRVSDVTVLGPLAVNGQAAGCSGLLLAGDAAGFVDPMTGDGLRFAVRGGVLAAEHALEELKTGDAQHGALRIAREREFSRKWLVNRALRTLVASPRGVTLAARLSAHWDGPVRSLIAIAGDVRLINAGQLA